MKQYSFIVALTIGRPRVSYPVTVSVRVPVGNLNSGVQPFNPYVRYRYADEEAAERLVLPEPSGPGINPSAFLKSTVVNYILKATGLKAHLDEALKVIEEANAKVKSTTGVDIKTKTTTEEQDTKEAGKDKAVVTTTTEITSPETAKKNNIGAEAGPSVTRDKTTTTPTDTASDTDYYDADDMSSNRQRQGGGGYSGSQSSRAAGAAGGGGANSETTPLLWPQQTSFPGGGQFPAPGSFPVASYSGEYRSNPYSLYGQYGGFMPQQGEQMNQHKKIVHAGDLGKDPHSQFCALTGCPPTNAPPGFKYRVNEKTLYGRAVNTVESQNLTYQLTAAATNTLLLLQIVLGAALTGLGGAGVPPWVITVFGAANTIIAGLVAYLKSRGQPMRARMFRDELERVVDEIENSEVMWLGIAKNVHGYDDIDTDGQVTVRSEVARLTRLFDRAMKTNTANNPDMYAAGAVGGGEQSSSSGMRQNPYMNMTAVNSTAVPNAPPVVTDQPEDESPATMASQKKKEEEDKAAADKKTATTSTDKKTASTTSTDKKPTADSSKDKNPTTDTSTDAKKSTTAESKSTPPTASTTTDSKSGPTTTSTSNTSSSQDKGKSSTTFTSTTSTSSSSGTKPANLTTSASDANPNPFALEDK